MNRLPPLLITLVFGGTLGYLVGSVFGELITRLQPLFAAAELVLR